MPTPDSLLQFPGRPGSFGAVMDEYARAAEDFCRVVEAFAGPAFTAPRVTDDDETRTPLAVSLHACSAAFHYAADIRKARGLDHAIPFRRTAETVPTAGSVRGVLREALHYTEGALDGFYDATDAQIMATKFTVSWGTVYDPEMMLEHAIVHLLRHRRQLERWGVVT